MKKLSVRDRAMMPLVQKELSTEDLKALKPWENPKTAPGASMAFHIKESVVFAENEKLKAELETFRDGSLTRVIDATLITRSKWANRHEAARTFVRLSGSRSFAPTPFRCWPCPYSDDHHRFRRRG